MYNSYLMGGAQLATITFFAPTSFAIWMISLDVVPLTIESGLHVSALYTEIQGTLTVDDQYVLVSKLERHSIQLSPNILTSTTEHQ